MLATITTLSSLFISAFILFLGNGLINVLLPVRLGIAQVSTDVIGLILSMYFVGMLVGGIYGKRLINRAGHIRMFAGGVSVTAIAILICGLYVDPILWGFMRFVIGFCNACVYNAIESWLSESSTTENRGKIMAFYQIVVLGGLFGGSFMTNLGSPEDALLFSLSGILLAGAVVPIVMSRSKGPALEETGSMPIWTLYQISPLGVTSCFISGIIYSAAFNLLPVFGDAYDITGFELSMFIGASLFGSFLLQYPVGYLTDKFDRRTMLFILLLISAGAGLSIAPLASDGLFWPMAAATALTCGIISCTYPISITEAFDRVKQADMVPAMGCLIFIFALGGSLGPFLTSVVMDSLGAHYMFIFLGAIQFGLCLFVGYRMTMRQALPNEDQSTLVMQSATSTVVMDLAPYTETAKPLSSEAKLAIELAESDPAAAVKLAKAIAAFAPERAVEIAGAIATVEQIDAMRLYDSLRDVVPDQQEEIVAAIVQHEPYLAEPLVRQLIDNQPERVVEVVKAIGIALPSIRLDLAKIAMDALPESAGDIADYHASLLAEHLEQLRPADREDDDTEQQALDLVSHAQEVSPEATLDIATSVAEAVPESAVSIARDIAENISDSSDELIASPASLAAGDEEAVDPLELVNRLSEAVPEQSLDVAATVAEALPERAVDIAEQLTNQIGEEQEVEPQEQSEQPAEAEPASAEEIAEQQEQDIEAASEIVQRLAEAAPEQSTEIAAAVVKAMPESAATIAGEVASQLAEQAQSEDEPTIDSEQTPEAAEAAATSIEEEQTEDDGERSDAVELVSALTEAAPEQALEIAAAVVESLPESATEVAEEYLQQLSNNDEESEPSIEAESDQSSDDELLPSPASFFTPPNNEAEPPSESLDVDVEAALEVAVRLAEAAPEQAVDIAATVVEAVPEAASEIIEAINEQIDEVEALVSDINDRPEDAPSSEQDGEPNKG